jgi:hypothetical protein
MSELTTIDTTLLLARLAELEKNHEGLTQEMKQLETHRQQGESSLLMLSGAIQILNELLGHPTITAPS